MPQLLKSLSIGAVTGAITYFMSIHTLGYTAAIAIPPGFPLAVWQALVVLGLGAALVAFLVHATAMWMFSFRVIPALLGFIAVVVAALAAEGLLPTGTSALAAWFVGASLALAVGRRLRPSTSSRPTPLRDAA